MCASLFTDNPDEENYWKKANKLAYQAEQWMSGAEVNPSGELIEMYIGNEHPSMRARTNCAAMMMDEFYRVFNVDETNAMYVAPEDRVELWGKE